MLYCQICQNGSKKTYDTEAEKLVKLEDCFDELMNQVIEEQNKQKRIAEMIEKIEQPFGNILFEVYILGKSLVKVASDMDYDYKHICYKHKIALKKFERLDK